MNAAAYIAAYASDSKSEKTGGAGKPSNTGTAVSEDNLLSGEKLYRAVLKGNKDNIEALIGEALKSGKNRVLFSTGICFPQ